MRDGDPTHTIKDVVCKRETPAAILVEIEDEDHWIPKSHIHDDSEVYGDGHEGKLVISQWLAEQRGF